uniref:Amidinotransferase n=1 Tax=Streptomyces sp. JCM 9888 TaxID=1570103 RepID=A0A0B5GUG4_9ACTN|nr:amidinotransferase [Streptomyces sp. JCM 9888]
MLEQVDASVMRRQTFALAEAFHREGVVVHLMETPRQASPNIVFLRDLFFMTPSGAVVSRMASQQRAGEERHVAAALAERGFPLVRTITGDAVLEGADCLWLDAGTVAVATGFRTNSAGAGQLGHVLGELGVSVVEVPIGPGVQHLLGSVVPLEERTAAVHSAAAGPELRELLVGLGYRLVEFDPDDEVVSARGLNLVPLAPGLVLMPAGAPGIRRRLEAEGIVVRTAEVGEYVKAAGGIGCITGILHRG